MNQVFVEWRDDQSICVGYATLNPDTNYLPPEQYLVNRLGRKIANLRINQPELRLGPDGKIMVTLREANDRYELHALSCSIQRKNQASSIELRRALDELVSQELNTLGDTTACFSSKAPEITELNGAGNFEVGGPEGDNGLAGKKLVVDCYGPHVPIGGGALSGKDFFKADRAGALHARRIAKAVVLTGSASEALVHLRWHPGNKTGEVLSITVPDGEKQINGYWQRLFDLSLESSGDSWTGKVDLIETARYGHFTNPLLPWEQVRFAGC